MLHSFPALKSELKSSRNENRTDHFLSGNDSKDDIGIIFFCKEEKLEDYHLFCFMDPIKEKIKG